MTTQILCALTAALLLSVPLAFPVHADATLPADAVMLAKGGGGGGGHGGGHGGSHSRGRSGEGLIFGNGGHRSHGRHNDFDDHGRHRNRNRHSFEEVRPGVFVSPGHDGRFDDGPHGRGRGSDD